MGAHQARLQRPVCLLWEEERASPAGARHPLVHGWMDGCMEHRAIMLAMQLAQGSTAARGYGQVITVVAAMTGRDGG